LERKPSRRADMSASAELLVITPYTENMSENAISDTLLCTSYCCFSTTRFLRLFCL